MRAFLAVTALTCWLGSSALADEPIAKIIEQSRLHYLAGENFYALGRYEDARREFEAGYALAPKPEFLLNLGQVERKLGDRAAAIDKFEKFLLATSAGDQRRAAVEDILKE